MFTMSPLCSTSLMGTLRPLIFAPVQVAPTCVWMSKAKSSTVAPRGSLRRSPAGVKTKISSEVLSVSMRLAIWLLLVLSSMISRSRASHSSLRLLLPFTPL